MIFTILLLFFLKKKLTILFKKEFCNFLKRFYYFIKTKCFLDFILKNEFHKLKMKKKTLQFYLFIFFKNDFPIVFTIYLKKQFPVLF